MNISIVATHPIQYQVPWFQALARQEGVKLKVLYALLPNPKQQGVGFGISFAWDIPMLEGYDWEALPQRRDKPSVQRFFGSSTPSVYRAIRRLKPAALIVTGWQSFSLIQALLSAKLLGVPCLVRGESNALRQRPWWTRPFHRVLLRMFDAFLAIGRANREFYLACGVPPDRIFPCRYFTDNERFQAQAAALECDRHALRNAWGIPDRHTCFLYAGKLEPKKRILDLLEAFAIAVHSRVDMHLLIVGSGVLMEPAQKLARARGLPVTFAGFLNQTEITRAYVASDCLVLPSDFGETWGLVVNEAMACGRPAIVSDRVGCGPDLITDGVTGAVFRFGDVCALASTLVGFASDPEKMKRMGAAACERVKAYSAEHAASGTLEAVQFVARSA